MTPTGSVTRWIDQLRAPNGRGRDEAAQLIWDRYSARLLAVARRHLARGVRPRADEEDVIQSTYKSFCRGHQGGRFELAGRDELWQVLHMIALRKARNLVERHARHRRDYRRDQRPEPGPERDAPVEVADGAPPPDEVAVWNEHLQQLFALLPDDLRLVALWRLEGHTNEEIAGPGLLNCSVRTVERKLERIRGKWAQALGDEAPEPVSAGPDEPPPASPER